jgi:hypothetical protein
MVWEPAVGLRAPIIAVRANASKQNSLLKLFICLSNFLEETIEIFALVRTGTAGEPKYLGCRTAIKYKSSVEGEELRRSAF